jgi:hypothetical protein
MDIYPGLDLGLHNFGAHLGFRYFFTEGFGIFYRSWNSIASYKTNPIGFDKLNNQFTLMERLSICKTKLFFKKKKRQFEISNCLFYFYLFDYKSNLIPCARGKLVV